MKFMQKTRTDLPAKVEQSAHADLPVKQEKLKKRAPQSKKSSKKRWITAAAALILIVVVVILLIGRPANSAAAFAQSDITTLSASDLQSTISATGTVESANSVNVYSTLNYKVNAIHVEVGESVNEGDLLCELDTRDLRKQIESRETSIGVSAESAQQQVKTARDAYSAAKAALDKGTNASIISAENSVTTAYDNWQKAQKTYNDYVAQLQRGENSSIMSQEVSASSAYASLDSAKIALDQAKQELNDASAALNAYSAAAVDPALEAAVASATTARNTAQNNYNEAQRQYNAAFDDYMANPTDAAKLATLSEKSALVNTTNTVLVNAQNDLTKAQQARDASRGADYSTLQANYNAKKAAYDAKSQAYDSAYLSLYNSDRQLTASRNNADTTLEDYKKNVETSYQTYQSALKSLQASKDSAQTSLQANKNSLDTALAGSNNDVSILELANLKDDLDATKITAPVSGTVTAVYATVGMSGSGLLFVIEDVDNLIVSTTIKEYDIGTARPGMSVTIKSDATGDAVYEGKLTSIHPTSQKDASGKVITSGDILFPTEVAVVSRNTGLRIGMSVRLKIVTEERGGVLAVPYDAVYRNQDGQNCVITLEEKQNGMYLLKEVPVTTGIETDLSIEVSGEGINESTSVVSIAANYRDMIGKELQLGSNSK